MIYIRYNAIIRFLDVYQLLIQNCCKLTQLGNPETSDSQDWQGFVDYAWSHAIVSDIIHKSIKENCNFYSEDTWSDENCQDAVEEVLIQYKHIDMYSLYTPLCTQNSTSTDDETKQMTFKRGSKMVRSYLRALLSIEIYILQTNQQTNK